MRGRCEEQHAHCCAMIEGTSYSCADVDVEEGMAAELSFADLRH
jgi:hypothetical protein